MSLLIAYFNKLNKSLFRAFLIKILAEKILFVNKKPIKVNCLTSLFINSSQKKDNYKCSYKCSYLYSYKKDRKEG